MDFPTKFMDSLIKGFECNERNKDQQDDSIRPPYLFEEPEPKIVAEVPLCELNEKVYLHLGKSLTISPVTVMI